MEWIALLAIILVLFLLKKWMSKMKNYPPGPIAFPIIGCIPTLALTKAPTRVDVLIKIAAKYGPVMSLQVGQIQCVVLNGYDAIKLALTREDFAVRPNFVPIELQCFGRRIGVLFNDGPEWRETRRFALRHLRDFGFGRRSMEVYIHEEARTLLKAMETEDFDLLDLLPTLSMKLIWSIMAGGKRQEDSEFDKLQESIRRFFSDCNAFSPLIFIPFLQRIPVVNWNYNKCLGYVEDIKKFVMTAIMEHEATYDEKHMRDFMDVYIREMKSRSEDTYFTRDQLCVTCMDLLSAATETTAAALSYALRFLIQNTEKQQKLRSEIHAVVGTERLPSMDDIVNLPYLRATIDETLRCSSPAALAPPHSVKSDTEFMGYIIPKDSFVLLNIGSAHMETEIWGDPETFRPERFITKDGAYKKDEHMIAFGLGSRVCMGESLARYSALLYLAALIQRFQFRSQGTQPLTGHIEGFTTSPTHFKMRIERITT